MITITFNGLTATNAETLLHCYQQLAQGAALGTAIEHEPSLGQLIPVTSSIAATAPMAPVTPAAPAPARVVPTAEVPTYTLQQLSVAAAPLLDAGRLEELHALIQRFGVSALTELPPAHYGAYATALRAMGAKI